MCLCNGRYRALGKAYSFLQCEYSQLHRDFFLKSLCIAGHVLPVLLLLIPCLSGFELPWVEPDGFYHPMSLPLVHFLSGRVVTRLSGNVGASDQEFRV